MFFQMSIFLKGYSCQGAFDVHKISGSSFFCLVALLSMLQYPGYSQEAFAYPFFKGTVSGTQEGLDFNAILGGAFSDRFIDASGSLSFLDNDKSESLVVDALWLELNYERLLYLKFGYFPELTSVSSIFPLLNVFQAPLFSDIVRWGGSFYPLSTMLAQLKIVHGAYSIKASVNPFEPAWTVISMDDYFFPTKQIPQSLDFGTYLGTYALHEARIEEPSWSWFDLAEVPEFSLEVAWQGLSFDVRILYFNGVDRTVSLEPNIVPNTYPFATYDFTLIPRRSSLSMLGASISVPLHELTLYSELTHTWNTLLISKTSRIAGTSIVFLPVSVDSLDISGGVLWSMPWLPIRIMAEGRYAWLTRTSEDLEPSSLGRAVSMGIDWSLFSDFFTLTPLFIVSLKDGSQAYSAKAMFAFNSGFKIWFLYMQCNGDAESELGQYRGAPIIRVGVEWSI